MMIPDAELDNLRVLQEAYLPDTVTILRPTQTSDGMGGWTESYQTAATTVGRISPRSGNELERGGAMTATAEFVVTLPYGTDVEPDDRLEIDGVTYDVKAVLTRSQQTALRVLVIRR